jgi:TatD DNase family protein
MILIDTHAHISKKDYSNRIDDLIQSAKDVGITKIINVGTNLKTSEECINLSEKYEELYATCGIHPHDADQAPKRYIYNLEEFAKHPKTVAIGEIGLDYHYNISTPKAQQVIYKEQLEFAKDIQLPAIVHCRDSDDDILEGLIETKSDTGVIHCFASDRTFAKNILETGFHISFTGMITFIKDLEKVVQSIPLEKIMLETDSPYLTPKPFRGKQNEPKNISYIASKIAEIKDITLQEVATTTTKTAIKLFNKLNNI